jgi:hypothetical protein
MSKPPVMLARSQSEPPEKPASLLERTIGLVETLIGRVRALEQKPLARDGRDGRQAATARTEPTARPVRDGVDGKAGADGKDGLAWRDGRNGIDGKDGAPGRDGDPGKDGASPASTARTERLGRRQGRRAGADGKDGLPGTDGKAHRRGKDGERASAANVDCRPADRQARPARRGWSCRPARRSPARSRSAMSSAPASRKGSGPPDGPRDHRQRRDLPGSRSELRIDMSKHFPIFNAVVPIKTKPTAGVQAERLSRRRQQGQRQRRDLRLRRDRRPTGSARASPPSSSPTI